MLTRIYDLGENAKRLEATGLRRGALSSTGLIPALVCSRIYRNLTASIHSAWEAEVQVKGMDLLTLTCKPGQILHECLWHVHQEASAFEMDPMEDEAHLALQQVESLHNSALLWIDDLLMYTRTGCSTWHRSPLVAYAPWI
jgi:hypothetical protein